MGMEYVAAPDVAVLKCPAVAPTSVAGSGCSVVVGDAAAVAIITPLRIAAATARSISTGDVDVGRRWSILRIGMV